jgi:uncharacterized protein YdeI (YjbR/CyaY-like superfamily)
MKPKFFKKQADFRAWLAKHHASKDELWVGYFKKATGKPSISWPQSVDEGLSFGWIDGIRKRIDDETYMIRFTPRRPNSHWSAVNIKRVSELLIEEKMQPPGIAAFQRRKEKKSMNASYEQKTIKLDPVYLSKLKENKLAWTYFQSMTPSYRKQCTWWIMSAKQEATRLRRLNITINSSEAGEFVPPLKWTKKRK